jgi:hypothetical protein
MARLKPIKLRKEREAFARAHGKAKFVCRECGHGQVVSIADLEMVGKPESSDYEKVALRSEVASLPGEDAV